MSFAARSNSIHRRRSRSISNHSSDEKRRITAKRARPSYLSSPSQKDTASSQGTHKWDVHSWKRGKRMRRDSSPSETTLFPDFLTGASTLQQNERYPVPLFPELPSTSAAFQLFPNRPRTNRRASYHSTPTASTAELMSADSEPYTADNLSQLRTDAFSELQRSIAEGGEGFVSRMRDWEDNRAQLNAHWQTSGEELEPAWQSRWSGHVQEECVEAEEDEDIQIVSNGTVYGSAPGIFHGRNIPGGASVLIKGMDVDAMDGDVFNAERCVSPVGTTVSATSGYASDDEPPLSHTLTSSSNSSLVSLSTPNLPNSSMTFHTTPVSPYHIPSSPSEKAVAALALVMANGAGGLNDYTAARDIEATASSPIDDSLIGEMWH